MHNALIVVFHVITVYFGFWKSVKVVGQGFWDILLDDFYVGVSVGSGLLVLEPNGVAKLMDDYSFL